MDTKILGILLSILGISGLTLGLIYMNDAVNSRQFALLFASGVVGAILFFVGIRLIPSGAQYEKPVEVRANKLPD